MADLHNLLGESPENDFIEQNERNDDEIGERPMKMGIPAALADKDKLDDKEGGGFQILSDEEEQEGGEDKEYTQLKRLWFQEMNCPELLPYDTDTVDLHLELLQGQDEAVDDLSDDSSMQASVAASIYKMEADRVRFLLADLHRTRLSKIEEHALHNRTLVDRMRPQERSYLRNYGEILEQHLKRTVLNHMPKDVWKKLDDSDMIDQPDLDEFVFCRLLESLEIDNRIGEDGEIQQHKEGDCLFARYATIRDYVLEGKVELLM